MLSCAAGVSAMFHTYISPEVYELFVKEVSARFGADINRFRTGYDCVSFLAFGLWYFEGVKWGQRCCGKCAANRQSAAGSSRQAAFCVCLYKFPM